MAVEPIAIIGMGCRFPGANSPDAFWQLMCDGVDAISEVPKERFDVDAYYDPEQGKTGKINSRWGGFIDDVDRFDANYFGIAPREVVSMDPQQRILLEVAVDALDDAGIPTDKLQGSETGVFVGISTRDYGDRGIEEGVLPTSYSGTGTAFSLAANRLSYVFDLHGPSLATDTACSSSLIATHLAVQNLRQGNCDMALAGGVNLILAKTWTLAFSQARMLSSDGRCKTFDASANGYVRSEGAGVIVLKRLSEAVRDGDKIAAIIRGTAANQDGRSNGVTAPNGRAQQAVIRDALRDAGLEPSDIDYVEAHGTGTPLGDPIEVDALKASLLEGRPADRACIIGSGKTNIGHMEAAAGMAGIIRAAYVLRHGQVPPHLHLKEMNPLIKLEGTPLRVVTALHTLQETGQPWRAGVNGFGFGGANCHLVLEQAAPQDDIFGHPTRHTYLLPLSAKTPEALTAVAKAYQEFLTANATDRDLHDLCYTASLRRTHHGDRLALAGDSRQDFLDHLEAFLDGEKRRDVVSGMTSAHRGKVAFVFSGMGTQWVGMGQQLLRDEPVFRETIERCDVAMRKYAGWSLLEELAAQEADSRLSDIGILQPVLFAIGVALADLWRSWGIEPDAVLGHSVGEVAAAYVAGALTLDDAARVVCRRGEALRQVSGKGAMVSVALPADEAERALGAYQDRVSAGVMNSRATTVLSGDPEAIAELTTQLESQGVLCRPVNADIAFHSPQMDELQDAFLHALAGIQPRAATIPLYSTVSGTQRPGEEFDPIYWIQNLRAPVAFAQTVEQLLAGGYDTFIELSPHPVLLYPIQETARLEAKGDVTALPSIRRREDEGRIMLQSLGALYTQGRPIAWHALYPGGGRCISLPAYPFQRERFWLEGEGKNTRRSRGAAPRDAREPLLGAAFNSAGHGAKRVWESHIDFDAFPHLADHRAGGSVVFPAAGFVEAGLAAAEALGLCTPVLEQFSVRQGLVLRPDGATTLQLVATAEAAGKFSLQFFSQDEGSSQDGEWLLHATATVRTDPAQQSARISPETPSEIEGRLAESNSGPEHYDDMRKRALDYGPAFQGVQSIRWHDAEALSRLRVPEAVAADLDQYRLPPAILDACLQTVAAMMPLEPYLPVSMREVRIYDGSRDGLWAHAIRLTEDKFADNVDADVSLYNAEDQVLMEVLGLRMARRRGARDEAIRQWLYETRWRAGERMSDRVPETVPPHLRGAWLILSDGEDLGEQLGSLLDAYGETSVMVTVGERYARIGSGHFSIDPSCTNDYKRLLDDAFVGQPACAGIVHLWGLRAPIGSEISGDSLLPAQVTGSMSVMHLVQALESTGTGTRPHIWLVTRGAQDIDGIDEHGMAQAPLIGVGRVLATEHPDLHCKRIDLDPSPRPGEVQDLFSALLTEDAEDEVALREGIRYVPRLERYVPDLVPSDSQAPTVMIAADEPFRLGTSKPGILDQLALRMTGRCAPGPGDVEIQVKATGLNFRDVMSAMGILPGYPDGLGPLGYECAGVVSAVGEDVPEVQVGDEVVALAYHAFGSYVTTNAHLVVSKPTGVSFEEAATIPITFLTAYYALDHLARLERGERVLIHAAAGGVGLAAIQMAQAAGAEIFATAGSPEKRAFLESLGVRHVMDSRSLDFADNVMELTDGVGVDVVLNSLAGDFIPKSLSVLAPYGRFLELGRKDIYQNSQLGLEPFQRNLSFFAIDLDKLYNERPAYAGKLLRAVMAKIEAGELLPLPLQVYPIAEAASAFRYMAQAKHIGKIVVSLDVDQVPVQIITERRIRSDGTYLITGGLGGLGLTVARWLATQGAGSLVLVSRRSPGLETQRLVESLQETGCQVTIVQADMSQEEQVARLLRDIGETLPPLRGIVHAAGVLDDGTLLQLDAERFERVMEPKVLGGWNLHALSKDQPLDFFVLFSSATALLGSGGQANYVAANQFLDALASLRRTQGLPALSIGWGPWSEVGMASNSDILRRFEAQGVMSITPQYGVTALGLLLGANAAQVSVVPLDWRRRLQSTHASAENPFLADVIREAMEAGNEAAPSSGSMRDEILSSPPEQRQESVEAYLRDQVGKVLGISVRKIGTDQALTNLGLDSLMAVELRNRIQSDLGTDVPVQVFLAGGVIAEIATSIVQTLFAGILEPASGVRSDELEEITL